MREFIRDAQPITPATRPKRRGAAQCAEHIGLRSDFRIVTFSTALLEPVSQLQCGAGGTLVGFSCGANSHASVHFSATLSGSCPSVLRSSSVGGVSGRSDASRPQKCMMRYVRTLTLSGFLFRDRPRTKGALPPGTPQAWAAGPFLVPPCGVLSAAVLSRERQGKGRRAVGPLQRGAEDLRSRAHPPGTETRKSLPRAGREACTPSRATRGRVRKDTRCNDQRTEEEEEPGLPLYSTHSLPDLTPPVWCNGVTDQDRCRHTTRTRLEPDTAGAPLLCRRVIMKA